MRLAALIALAAAASGCAGDAAELSLAGTGGGEREDAVTCDGEGGVASLVLAIEARLEQGVATFLVLDGIGAQVHERHLAVSSGIVDEERSISGAPGAWSLAERRTDDFRGELRATLTCE